MDQRSTQLTPAITRKFLWKNGLSTMWLARRLGIQTYILNDFLSEKAVLTPQQLETLLVIMEEWNSRMEKYGDFITWKNGIPLLKTERMEKSE